MRWPWLSDALDRMVDAATRIPYPEVPHKPQEYLARVGRLTIAKKYLHKRLALWRGSPRGEWTTIPPGSRILWLHTGKPNIGDTLMELSCRRLLKGRGYTVDLLTVPKLQALFAEDDVFRNVLVDPSLVDPQDYDVVLLQEYNHPSLRLRRRYFRALPHACLFQYFYGPARNQTAFGFHAANRLFALGLSVDQVRAACAPYLTASPATHASVRQLLPEQPFVAVAVGGIDPRRSYSHWPALLALLGRQAMDRGIAPLPVVLLGSDNGLSMQEALAHDTPPGVALVPLANRLTLLQSQAVAARASALIACDGGLMHLAHSTGVPSVTLFAAGEPPEMFLPPGYPSVPLYSPATVNDLSPQEVADAYARLQAGYQRTCESSANSSA